MSDLTDRLRRAPIPCVTTGQFDAGLCVCCEAAAALEAAEAKLAAIDALPYNSEASRYADGWNHARQKIRRILHPKEAQ